MKKFFNGRILGLFLSALAVIGSGFISCEVGLGESVDTQPPKIEVEVPEASTVIKGTFTMSGTCSDEQGVVRVTVTLRNKDNQKEYGPFEGVVVDRKSWKCTISPVETDPENPSDIKFIVPDGTYEATATAYDKSEKSTKSYKTIVLDNTAPLLVLTRPSTKGEIDRANIDTYGQQFDLTGQVADDNDIDRLIVRVYDSENNLVKIKDSKGEEADFITLNNVPPTIDLTVAKYGTSEYESIYGEDGSAGTKYYRCEIEIYDSARTIPETEESTVGNKRTVYYLYNDIYSPILKNYKITEIYHMLNGSYETDRGLDATKEEVEAIKKLLNSEEYKTGKGTFSLNPANNPSYTISSYSKVSGTDTEKYQAIIENNQLLSGSAMTVKLSAGLDKAPLVKNSLGAYVLPYIYDSVSKTAVVDSDPSHRIWLMRPLEDKTGKYKDDLAKTDEEKAARSKLSAVGSYDYTADFDMTIDKGFAVGQVYSLYAIGYDENDVSFVNSDSCGFYYQSSGSAPRLTITDPVVTTVYVGKAEHLDDTAINISGKVTSELKSEITLKVIDSEGNETPVDGVSYQSGETPFNEPWGPLAIPASYFKQGESNTYSLVVTASCDGRTSEKEITVYYDVDGPVVDGPIVTPVVNANGREDNINGKISAVIRISDAFSRVDTSDNKPELTIYNEDGSVALNRQFSGSVANINAAIDTRVLGISDKQLLTFEVTAFDIAGNKTVSRKKLYLDQETDRPVLELTNAAFDETAVYIEGGIEKNIDLDYTIGYPESHATKNVFMSGAPVTATISDDDGIDSVVVKVFTEDGSSVVASKTYSKAGGEINSNPWPLSYAVPSAIGTYKLSIVVTDVEGNQNGEPHELYFIVDSGAPTITVNEAANAKYYGKQSGPIEVRGTVTGLNGLKIYRVYDPEHPLKNVLIDVQPDPSARSFSWSDEFIIPADTPESLETDSGFENNYWVVDSKGRAASAALRYWIDNTVPVVTITTELPDGIVKSTSQKFQGVADDLPGGTGKVSSNVSALYYQIKKAGETVPSVPVAEKDAVKPEYGWQPLSGANSWNFFQGFYENGSTPVAGSLSEGDYVLYVCAYDAAQNGSSPASFPFSVDLNVPDIDLFYSTDGASYTAVENNAVISIPSAYTVKFTLADTYGLKSPVPYAVTIVKDDVNLTSGTDFTVSYDAPSKAGIITVLQGAGKKGSGDGNFKYTVQAIDAKNRSSEKVFTITRDTEPPVIEISYPEASEWVTKDSVKVTGTALDTSGVLAVYWNTSSSAAKPASGSDAKVDSNWTSKGWKKATGSNSWYAQISGLSVGQTPYYFAAVDKYGNISEVTSHTLNYDGAIPVISETKYQKEGGAEVSINNNGSVILNKGFTFKGKVTDDFKIKSISINGGKSGQAKTQYFTTGDISSQNLKEKTFEKSFTTSQLTDGVWEFEVVAVDASDRECINDYTFTVDTTNPVISGTPTLCSNQTPGANGWYTQSRGLISITVSDSLSGISSVTYFVGDSVIPAADLKNYVFDNTLTGSNGIYTKTHAFAEGKNYVFIKIEDNAGNVTYYGGGSPGFFCNIDTAAPVAEFVSPRGGSQINGNQNLTVTISAADETSKFTGSSKAAVTMKSAGVQKWSGVTSAIPAEGGNVTVTVPKAVFEGVSNPVFDVVITDAAGNQNVATGISVTIDNDPPSVKINSPVTAQINGQVTVSGSSTDLVGVESLEIYRTKLAGDAAESTDLTVASGEWAGTYHQLESLTGSDVYNWTANFDSTVHADGTAVKFYVVAKDAAGNKGVAGKATVIDQDADRPVITFSNITLAGMTSAAPHLHQEAELRGIISDDDGIKSFKIAPYSASIDWASAEEVYDNGSWSYTLTAGDKALAFRVVDENNGVFISDTSNITSSPKLIDKNGTTIGYKGDAVKDTKVYLSVDLTVPVIAVKVNGSAAVNPYYTSAYTYSFDITDDYKLSAVTYSVTKNGEALVQGADGFEVNFTTDETAHKAGTIAITGSKAGDGTYAYEIQASDIAGNRPKVSNTIVLDTTAPVLAVTSPEAGVWQSKKAVTIYGTSDDISGISAVYYKTGIVNPSAAVIADGLTESKWTADGWKKLEGKTSWKFTTAASTPEGVTDYSFAAVDIYGNVSETGTNYQLSVDIDIPRVAAASWTKEGGSAVALKDNSTFITNKTFSMTGTVTDSYRLEEVSVTASKDSKKILLLSTFVASTSYNWSTGNVTVGSGNTLEDGTWTITLAVTDAAGKVTETVYTAVVDTIAPVVSSVQTAWNGLAPVNGYYKYATPSLNVSASDSGSGLASVYCLSSTTVYYPDTDLQDGHQHISDAGIDYPMNVTGVAGNYTRKLSLSDGTSYAYVKVIDEAGNVTYAGQGGSTVLNVDTVEPIITFSKPDASMMLSTAVDLEYEISVSDELSGILENTPATVKVGTISATGAKVTAGKISGTIPSSQMSTLTGDSAVISVTVPDAVGNMAAKTLTLTFDNTPPVVKISNPQDGVTSVNGIIRVSGTAKDNVGLNFVKLYYSVDGGAETLLKTFSGSDAYSWESDDFDTSSFDGRTILFKAIGEDTAQNKQTVTRSVTVDQDSDRPEIKFTNVNMTGMLSSNFIMNKAETIYGTVTDDDGVSGFYVSTNGGTDWSSNCYDSGSWTYTFSDDQKYTLTFKVVDAEGTTFISDNGSGSMLTSPKLYDTNGNKFGYKVDGAYAASSDTHVYVQTDTQNPVIAAVKFKTSTGTLTFTDSEIKNYSTDDTWKADTQLTTVGGTNSYIYLLFDSSDASGIKAISVTGLTSATVVKNVNVSETRRIYVVQAPTDTGSETSKKIRYTVTDKADRTKEGELSVTIDNNPPEIQITSHKPGAGVYGSIAVNLRGDASDCSELYMKVTGSAVAPAANYGLDGSDPTHWERIDEYTSAGSWSIIFDSGTNVVGNIDYYSSLGTLNKYYDALFTPPSSDIAAAAKPMYIWLYGKDELGNTSSPSATTIKGYDGSSYFYYSVNPQGDQPTVDVSYPSDGDTVGGAIRVYGSTTVALGGVENVFIQIDPSYDGSAFNNSWESELNALLPPGFTDYEVVDSGKPQIGRAILAGGSTSSWNKTINASSEFVLIEGGEKKNREMAIRVYAVSNGGKVSDPVVVPFTLDPNAPVIGGTEELYLVQYDNTVNFSTMNWETIKTHETRRQKYESGMWVQGQWYLTGSIEDDSGLKTVKWDGADIIGDSSKVSLAADIPSSTSSKNYYIHIPVGSTESGKFGTKEYNLLIQEAGGNGVNTESTIKVLYDNMAPVFKATNADYSEELSSTGLRIVQSNGTYTLQGTVNEDGALGNNQSGFNRVLMFFTRHLNGVDYIVDPMISSGATGLANAYNINSLTKKNNMYWKPAVITAVTSDTLTFSSITKDTIRAGALCKINDIDYIVKSVNYTTKKVQLKSIPTAKAGDTAYFAVAQVIDNLTVETGTTVAFDFDREESVTNGDKDYMIEGVTSSGTQWKWTASIDSTLILDGSITVNFIAYDKAGNASDVKQYSGTISNNTPRIAGLKFGTDENSNGVVDESELVLTYSGLYSRANTGLPNGYKTANQVATEVSIPVNPVDLDDPSYKPFNIKGAVKVRPELVGGNHGIGYNYKVTNRNESSTIYTINDVTQLSSGHSSGDVIRPSRAEGSSDAAAVDDIDIPLSQMVSNNLSDGKNFKFKFTFWDYTDGATPGVDTNSAELSLYANVGIYDLESPTVSVNKFFWNSASENSLYQNSKANGHIELEGDLPSATFSAGSGEYDKDPKVSGKIVLRGTANDNALLKKLYITIPGVNGGTKMEMASFNEATGTWTTSSDLEGTTGISAAVTSSVFSNETGHTVNWEVYWDTAKISGVTALDVGVTVSAEDRGKLNSHLTYDKRTTGNPSEVASSPYRMDVVPYVTSISRNSRFNTNRARSGAIPLLRGETLNTITGFNLGTTTNTSVKIDSEQRNGSSSKVWTMTNLALNEGKLTFTVPNTAKSGYVHVVVNNVVALNNLNGYVDYNTESDAKSFDHNIKTDDRYAQIWRVTSDDTFKGSKNCNYPAMSKNPTNNVLYASFTNYGQAMTYYTNAFTGNNDVTVSSSQPTQQNGYVTNNNITSVFYGFDPPEDTDISVGPDGKVNVFYNANYQGGASTSWNGVSSTSAGGVYVFDEGGKVIDCSSRYAKGYRFELYTYDNELNQFKNIRVNRTVVNNVSYANVVYYDRLTNAIKYSYATGGTDTKTYALPWVVIDGSYDATDTSRTNFVDTSPRGSFTFAADSSWATKVDSGVSPFILADSCYEGISRTEGTGSSVAITATNTGMAVILYMDAATGQLRIARANSLKPSATSNWKVQGVFDSSDENFDTASDYMSAIVDPSGYLHIAFQNTKGQLVYAKSTNNPSTGSIAYTFGSSQVIDDSGMWIDMTLNGTTPHISYLSKVNSYDGMKIAYWDENYDGNNDGIAEGGWETMTAPLNAKVTNTRSCIEVNAKAYDNQTYAAAIGFCPGSDYRAAFFVGK